MGGTAETSRVEHSIAINEEELGPQLWLRAPQSVEKYCVDGHLLEGQEAWDVRVLCSLNFEVFV